MSIDAGPSTHGLIHGLLNEDSHEIHLWVWREPLIDPYGFDPRSDYVETYWLPVLGPSATLLLRRLGQLGAEHPGGVDIDVHETALSLGLGQGARYGNFLRALGRLDHFGMVRGRQDEPGSLGVRYRVSPLPLRHIQRLPTRLALQHQANISPLRTSHVG